ncbi:hypothetical protein [Mycolicibacterium flavescens]|uniref:hypothetical protein n=1 Tax=Mycolicibacterium flavescens TaxID=1776 RepID=UPI001F41775E|nr:hypothetical protein [Mycolicibacterium flavescens]
MTRAEQDDRAPWYNRTPEVVGASLAALVVIGLLVFGATFVSRQFSEPPPQAPLNFVEPSFTSAPSRTPSSPATTATTGTITSTSPPQTTDINDTTTPSESTTSESETTSERRPRVRDSDEQTTPRTTRRGPRTNVTRTLNPFN